MQYSLPIIIQLSSAAPFVTIHSIPLTCRLTAPGAPLRGIKCIVSAATCANWIGTHPFVKYTFSNKNWQRNAIAIQGAAEALSREKINCHMWQVLNRLDNGFIILPWNSLTEISDKHWNRKGACSTDNRWVSREESMESHLKQHEHHLTRHQFLACWQASKVKW